MIPALHIRLLGDFLLISDETPLTAIDLSRLQSLLVYLLLHRTAPQPRSHLAYLFWPDTTDAQALSNLRTLVHRLRLALPHADAYLQVDRQNLQWQPEQANAPWTLDVLDFEDALIRAERAEQVQDVTGMRQALEQAVALYRGDLLPSCYDEWILPERDHLRQAFLRALERLIVVLEREHDYDLAIDLAQRLLRHDPLHEPTYRRLMRLYAARGDRVAALRVYHTCTSVLERELGAEPSRATREVYERVMHVEETVVSRIAPQAPKLIGTPLVGRRPEWAQLQAIWRQISSKGAYLVVLSGEGGIGKTRLAEELVAWASRQGAAIATARCYAAEGELAYAPVTAWLRSDAVRTALPRLAAIWLTEVARLVPDVLVERPGLPHPGPLVESWQRQRLFEALARAILAARQPLFLLLDDIHRCDRETLEWLHYLFRFDPQFPLLVIGTLRPEEMAAGHPLRVLLTALQRNQQITEIPLGALGASETAVLAAQEDAYDFSHDKLREAAYATLSATRRRLLHRNVAHALERVQAGASDRVSGQIAAHYERAGLPEQAIPYYQRAGELAQQTYANVKAIAAFQRALALLETAPLEASRQAWRMEAMASLHERVGDLLALAGQHDAARAAYQRALTLVQDHIGQARLQCKIGNTWETQRKNEAALQAYRTAERLLGQTPSESAPQWWQQWFEIQRNRLQVHYWLAQTDEMTELIERTRPIVERYGTPAQRAAFFQSLYLMNIRRNRYMASEEALAYAQAALMASEEGGTVIERAWAHLDLGGAYRLCDQLDEAEIHLQAALEAGEQTGELMLHGMCLTFLSIVYKKRGQVDAVRDCTLQAGAVANKTQNAEFLGMVNANRAWLAWREGK